MLKVIRGWTEDEVRYLIDNYSQKTCNEIAKDLNKTTESVGYAARENGLVKQIHKPWADDEIQFLKDNYLKMTSAEIAHKLNRSVPSISRMKETLCLSKLSKWSKGDVEYLKVNFDKMSYEEIGLKLNRTAAAVDAKCFDLGLQKKEKPWEDWEYQYLKQNYMEMSTAEIAETLGRSITGVRLKASRNGWKKSPYNCNYHYFSSIDSEEKSYWLGFLMADGWIYSNEKNRSGCIGVELQYGDIGHLRKLNKCLDGNYKIDDRYRKCNFNQKNRHSCVLRIYSHVMYDDLRSLGFTNNKSFEAIIPPIRDDLKRHFIRGYFDGNGSVSIRKQHDSCFIKFTTASRQFVEDLKEELKRNNIEMSEYESINEYNTTVYDPYISGTEANRQAFLDYIYKDSTIYLDRKYNKYLKYTELRNKRKPRQSEMTGFLNCGRNLESWNADQSGRSIATC